MVIVIAEVVMNITLVILNSITMTQNWDMEVNGPSIIHIRQEENFLRTCHHRDTENIETRDISGRVGYGIFGKWNVDQFMDIKVDRILQINNLSWPWAGRYLGHDFLSFLDITYLHTEKHNAAEIH